MLADTHMRKLGLAIFLILVVVGAQYNFALTLTFAFLVSAVSGLIVLRKPV